MMHNLTRAVFLTTALISTVWAFSATADTDQIVGRYLTVQEGASVSQQDPLQQGFMMTFPTTVRTVGDAIVYVLGNSGYQLVPSQYQSSDVQILLQQVLPLSDRSLGPMTILQALSALSGNTYQILIDPNHRYIAFVLYPSLNTLYSN